MRIGIIGDDNSLSGTLRTALDSPPFSTVATDRTRPDVFVSSHIRGRDSAEVLHAITQAHSKIPVLIVAAQVPPIDIRHILAMGAAGILLQETAVQHVSWAIPTILSGCRALSPEISESLISEYLGSWPITPQEQSAREKVHGLSRREQEVLHLLSRGMSNREIARCLFISPETVKDHVRAIRSKLGAPTRIHAAHVAWLARCTTAGTAA